jgi:hypothetical protein
MNIKEKILQIKFSRFPLNEQFIIKTIFNCKMIKSSKYNSSLFFILNDTDIMFLYNIDNKYLRINTRIYTILIEKYNTKITTPFLEKICKYYFNKFFNIEVLYINHSDINHININDIYE